jgi:hypothetical protein
MPKLCIDCKYIKVIEKKYENPKHYCTHPDATSAINGALSSCEEQRGISMSCGHDATNFISKDA